MRLTPGLRTALRVRTLVLLVFAFGLAAQSLITLPGEIHEVAAHAERDHGHASHHDVHQHDAPDDHDTGDDVGDPLHALLHHAHSCSHCAWMSSGTPPLATLAMAAASLPGDTALGMASSRLSAPFRPPIPA